MTVSITVVGWAEICCPTLSLLVAFFLILEYALNQNTVYYKCSSCSFTWKAPSIPFFLCPSRGTYIHPSHASPPTIAVIPTAQVVVVTPQGALAPPACSSGCHTFVHFRWVPVHNILLFLRSLLFLSSCILFSQSMLSTSMA